MKGKSLSCVRLLATPWAAAYQAPSSMGLSRQEYWSGVPLPAFYISRIPLVLLFRQEEEYLPSPLPVLCSLAYSFPPVDLHSYQQVFCTHYRTISDTKGRSNQLPSQPFLVMHFHLLMSLRLPFLVSSKATVRVKWGQLPCPPSTCL